jgi:signal peptidase I
MADSTQRKSKGALYSAVELVLTVAVAIGLALLIQRFIVKPYKIPSTSMLPTLVVGQRVLANRLDTSPGLGDVVVFHPPAGADNSADPICGNPAQGGQQGGAGKQACDAPTPAESDQTFIKRVVGLPGDTLSIINGHAYRDGVREKDPYIEPCGGAPTCTYQKPIKVPAGMYYMMGDNRGGSDDSRFWGPVPEKWIIGVAFFTYWPPDRIGTL